MLPKESAMKRLIIFFLFAAIALTMTAQSNKTAWHAATQADLQALLPARATVEKEHIETEMRTASGITDGHGKFVAGVVLITAGYSADGKYSHYMVVQTPIAMGELSLTTLSSMRPYLASTSATSLHTAFPQRRASSRFASGRQARGSTYKSVVSVCPMN
jgi:hypothetical protein